MYYIQTSIPIQTDDFKRTKFGSLLPISCVLYDYILITLVVFHSTDYSKGCQTKAKHHGPFHTKSLLVEAVQMFVCFCAFGVCSDGVGST